MQQIRFTKEGYEKLNKEYDSLVSQRPDAVEDLKKARELGDLSENGFYKAARAKLSSIDSRLRRMLQLLNHAVVIDGIETDAAGIGTTVVVHDGKREITYYIVGDTEADPVHGKISLYSPIGSALAGKKAGESIMIEIPSGTLTYKISRIS